MTKFDLHTIATYASAIAITVVSSAMLFAAATVPAASGVVI